MKLNELELFLANRLSPERFKDYGINGVQIETTQPITRVAMGVTASMECIDAAIAWGAQILIVHHGLFWGPTPLRGFMHKRVKALFTHDVGLLAYHLPLDAHEELGHSSVLATLLGCSGVAPFAERSGGTLGITGNLKLSLPELLSSLEQISGPIFKTMLHGPTSINKVGIVSGDGSFALQDAILQGCDTFITGEVSGPSQYLAKEEGVNYIALGHELSEQFGMQALGDLLHSKLGLETKFFIFPFEA